jgi:hypothetical protein
MGWAMTSTTRVAGEQREEPLVTVTYFADKMAERASEETLSLPRLAAKIQRATARTKDCLPWLKLARFGEMRSDKGSLRHDGNVVVITGIEVDYDGEQISFENAVETVERAGIIAIVYTSPSHRAEKPRWRV